MSGIQITLPDHILRGMCVDAATSASVDGLTNDLAVCWETVDSLRRRLAPDDVVTMVVQIWLDSGRIFWVVRANRERFRFELEVRTLEEAYHSFLDSPDFDTSYEILLELVRNQVRASLPRRLEKVSIVVVRDCDDKESQVVLFQD